MEVVLNLSKRHRCKIILEKHERYKIATQLNQSPERARPILFANEIRFMKYENNFVSMNWQFIFHFILSWILLVFFICCWYFTVFASVARNIYIDALETCKMHYRFICHTINCCTSFRILQWNCYSIQQISLFIHHADNCSWFIYRNQIKRNQQCFEINSMRGSKTSFFQEKSNLIGKLNETANFNYSFLLFYLSSFFYFFLSYFSQVKLDLSNEIWTFSETMQFIE